MSNAKKQRNLYTARIRVEIATAKGPRKRSIENHQDSAHSRKKDEVPKIEIEKDSTSLQNGEKKQSRANETKKSTSGKDIKNPLNEQNDFKKPPIVQMNGARRPSIERQKTTLSTARAMGEIVSNIKKSPYPMSAKTANVSFGGVQMLGTPSSEGTDDSIPNIEVEHKHVPSASILKTVRDATPEDSDDPKDEADIDIPSDDSHSVSLSSSSDDEDYPRENVVVENPRLPRQPSSRLDVIKTFLNVVVIGHVDHGKSTLIGHLAHKCDAVDNETINQLAKESDMCGKSSFKFAWVMDRLKAERQRGVTIDSKIRRLDSRRFHVNMIDVPGHKDYVHNMVTGTTQGDVALLVASAEHGEFESGLKKRGQTREHLQLAYNTGIKQLIVVISKMDSIDPAYNEVRFRYCIDNIALLAKKVGFDVETVPFIPISGWEGDNLITPSSKMPWFSSWKVKRRSGGASGKTLLDAIDSSEMPFRMTDRPLRVPIHTVYKLGEIGIVTAGRIHCGYIRPDMGVSYAPNNIHSKVRAVQVFREVMDEARPGDNVGIQIENYTLKDIRKGDVCGDTCDDPPQAVTQFTAQIRILNHPGTIKKGYTPILHCHTSMVACKFLEIKERCDRRTGQCAEENPSCLRPGELGVVDLKPIRPICVECFFDYPSLGRIIIRDMKQTIAIGVIIFIPGRLPPPFEFQRNYGVITRMTGITGLSFGLMSRPTTTGFGAITSVSQYGGDTRPNTKGVMISEPLPYCTEEVEDDDGSVSLTSEDALPEFPRTFRTKSGRFETEF
ncbi:elongation factor 1-alpha [Mytilus galloprovincialis]|uniref:Elongation factor 1-alpha n=1 Tax=Mytilus galloprovincialis TaxID=29158 RepID=A0A8B6GIJ8_MYTGA|nr:elongation factor 1-alpha [Mytilus galloprovincialis]